MKKFYCMLFACLLFLCACGSNASTPISIDTSFAPKPAASTTIPTQSAAPLTPSCKPPYRIACIFPQNDTAEWSLIYQSCATAIEALSTLEVTGYCVAPSVANDTQAQIALIETAVKDGVDGILLSPTDATAIGDYITQNFTTDSHAFIMSVGQELVTESPYVVAHIGTDLYAAGKDMAKIVSEALGPGGNYILIGNEATIQVDTQKRQGIQDTLITAGTYTALTDTLHSTSLDKALSYIDSLADAASQEKIALLITDPAFIVPIAQKVSSLKNKTTFHIVGFGISAEILSLMESGVLYGTIGENNYLLGFNAPFYLIDFFEAKQTKALMPVSHTVLTRESLASPEVQDYLQSIGLL